MSVSSESVSSESCYDCGRDLPDGVGEPLYTCLWNNPNTGGNYWGWVRTCPACGGARRRRRLALLFVVGLFVSALTAALAYPLLP